MRRDCRIRRATPRMWTDALRRVGFATVTLETDLPKDHLTEALRTFAKLADEADWALVYYAGRGIEMRRRELPHSG